MCTSSLFLGSDLCIFFSIWPGVSFFGAWGNLFCIFQKHSGGVVRRAFAKHDIPQHRVGHQTDTLPPLLFSPQPQHFQNWRVVLPRCSVGVSPISSFFFDYQRLPPFVLRLRLRFAFSSISADDARFNTRLRERTRVEKGRAAAKIRKGKGERRAKLGLGMERDGRDEYYTPQEDSLLISNYVPKL